MTQQEIKEAIEAFKDRKAELVEWDFSQSCIDYYDTAIKALETVQKIRKWWRNWKMKSHKRTIGNFRMQK